ncbi:structural protein [Pseudomonas phage PIP]|nr:structural protein [Pseudomonas phage PIP]
MTVGRGVLDPSPRCMRWRPACPLTCIFETDQVEYAQGETARTGCYPLRLEGTLAEGPVPAQTLTIQAHPVRPYYRRSCEPIRRRTLTPCGATRTTVVTWVHRDRLQQTATSTDTEAASTIRKRTRLTLTIC